MKRMVWFIVFMLFVMPNAAWAGSGGVEAGLAPGSNFYWLDRLAERVSLVFTLSPRNKAKALSKIGLERLAEAEEVDTTETIDGLIADFVAGQEKARELAGDDLDTIIALNADQLEALGVLSGFLETADTTDGPAGRALETTALLLVKQVRKIEKAADHPQAARKAAQVIEKTTDRLNKTALKLSRQSTDTSATTDTSAAVDTSATVDGTATPGGPTEELIEHVNAATAKHLAVLESVLEKAPESAKPALERALEKSAKGHEKAVEAVGRRGQVQKKQK